MDDSRARPIQKSDAPPSGSTESFHKSHPSFGEAARFWFKLGWISFGGPTGQIAIMHQELVEKKKWVGEAQFLHALNFCMLLPGPEAMQLATYSGWLLHGIRGGIIAGLFFFLPSAFILWALSLVYVRYGQLEWVAAIFYGLKPAVLAIVAAAALRIGAKVLKNEVMVLVSAFAFIAIFFLKIDFPWIVLGALAFGWLGAIKWGDKFAVLKEGGPEGIAVGLHARAESSVHGFRLLIQIFLIGLALWWFPVLVAGVTFGWGHTLVREGLFFSKAAVVTFGGAYAVLPYVSQQAVELHGWLTPEQMLDGLGLAETTPGPLIMVLQFVGFLGGWNHPGDIPPLLAATLGAFMTTWVTFVPCFLWIILGAPYVERLRGNQRIGGALSVVTAAVVGVILNLAVWFALHLFRPAEGVQFDIIALIISIIAFLAIKILKCSVISVVLLGAGLGLVAKWFVWQI
jgi:chromate transporter